jgi:hypothetical protein
MVGPLMNDELERILKESSHGPLGVQSRNLLGETEKSRKPYGKHVPLEMWTEHLLNTV